MEGEVEGGEEGARVGERTDGSPAKGGLTGGYKSSSK